MYNVHNINNINIILIYNINIKCSKQLLLDNDNNIKKIYYLHKILIRKTLSK
jgi:hypothetical protein